MGFAFLLLILCLTDRTTTYVLHVLHWTRSLFYYHLYSSNLPPSTQHYFWLWSVHGCLSLSLKTYCYRFFSQIICYLNGLQMNMLKQSSNFDTFKGALSFIFDIIFHHFWVHYINKSTVHSLGTSRLCYYYILSIIYGSCSCCNKCFYCLEMHGLALSSND